jgi:phosphodiesterase/alkaline phosphatase D-like protein
MNRNVLIGIVIVLVLAVGGYYLVNMNNMSATGGAATSTATTTGTQDNTTPGTGTSVTPAAPRVVTDASVAPTNSTAVVTGKVTPNGAPTTYWYEYGLSSTLGSKTSAQSVGSGWSAIASPGYITGLRANTLYYFRLSAQNSHGTVNGTTYSFTTNNNPPAQGTAPAVSTNAATAVTRTSATLNAHVNAHSSQTTYWFEYGTGTDFGQVTSFQSGGSGNASNAVSAAVSGLSPQTKYYFRINAQNQYGTVNGATQSFTTSGPATANAPVVTTQVASPVATTTATLRGTVNPSGTQTTYWFEYSTDSLLGSVLVKTTPHKSAGANATTDSISADVSGLAPATTYYYRTVAQNAAGTVRGDNLTFTTK